MNIGEADLPSNKIAYALHRNQTIIESTLAVKIFPSHQSGFQMVGFIKAKDENENPMEILLNLDNMHVEGVTRGFLSMANIYMKKDSLLT